MTPALTPAQPSSPRTLWLLRHAKAAEGVPGGDDHDRPLSARGRRDAAALGARLAALDLPGLGGAVGRPDGVLCSTAARTTETATLAAGGLGIDVDRRRSLYYANPDGVLDELRTADDALRSLLVVGHNPATHALALGLLAPDDPDRRRLDRYPTCALAVFLLRGGRWSEVAAGGATLAGFFTPPFD